MILHPQRRERRPRVPSTRDATRRDFRASFFCFKILGNFAYAGCITVLLDGFGIFRVGTLVDRFLLLDGFVDYGWDSDFMSAFL